jgi:transcriptional regulator with XRE-family HTH domain
MKLKKFIKKNGYTYGTFAKEINVPMRNVSMWARGERLPRWKDAKKIFEITDYQVNGQDLYDQQILRKEGDI